MAASQGYGKNERFEQAHDDILGTIVTGIAGSNQWLVKNIGDTLYPLHFLRDNSNDFYCFHAQSPHWRKQGHNLDSIHVHYLLDTAYTAGETLVFDVYWAWVVPNTVFPSLANWESSLNVTIILDSTNNLPQYYTSLFSLVSPVPPPIVDGYGTGLIVRIVRGNGTYGGDLGVWWSDAHAVKDKNGSYNEYWD